MAQAQRATESSPPQVCEHCESSHVQRTVITTLVVYFRCEDCGWVWNISERRRLRRPSDPERLDL